MARKHGRTAPYEIMRQVGGSPPEAPAPKTLRAAADTPPTAPDGDPPRWFSRIPRVSRLSGLLGWFAPPWSGVAGAFADRIASWGLAVRSPVALRLPAVALGGIVLAGTLILSGVFWFGSQMGQRAAMTDGLASTENGGPFLVVAGADALIDPSQLAQRAWDAQDTPGGAIDLPTADPRIDGYNYLCFVSLRGADIDEARRIQRFFQQAGVATILTGSKLFDPASGKKPDGWIQVIDVSRGFSESQMHNGEYESFYTARRALGRAWKAHNRSIGSDLNTMMFYKFKPSGS